MTGEMSATHKRYQMQELLTLKEIARQIGVPESNLRYYRNRIGDFAPSVGKGRRRRYLPEAIDVFRRTTELVQEGMTLDRIHTCLEREQSLEPDDAAGGGPSDDVIEKIAGKIREKLSEVLNTALAASTDGAALAAENAALKARLQALEEQLSDTKERTAALETAKDEAGANNMELTRTADGALRESKYLKEEKEEKEAELAEARKQLAEKEKILELQKQQLLEARDRRLNIIEELRHIRDLLETGGQSGAGRTL
jgi:DNA-binding transcriptional MerR regulator